MSTTDTPTSQALERSSPAAMVQQYKTSFTSVLPSHISKPESWLRLAQAALKKGQRGQDGRTQLEVAAANNPAIFMATLLDCARLGLEPGTEQYYLTPRKVKGGRTEILGIVGYQGYVELMYRAGAVESVVAECVYRNDVFTFRPGVDQVPQHEIDWDSDDRGDLRLVYAFARMNGGAISKVVVLNRADIARIKAKAQNPGGDYSPWRTDEPSMWLKSAVRQLRKWVPTSAEYRREQLRAEAEVADQRAAMADHGFGQELPPVDALDGEEVHDDEGDDGIVDAEIVEPDPDDDPPPPSGGGGQDPEPAHGDGDQGTGDDATGRAGRVADSPEPEGEDFPDLPEPEPVAEQTQEAPARRCSIGANDVARYAREVFKKDYQDAPNGQKTKVVERLRHAVAFAQSGGKKTSLNDLTPEELWGVNQRLREIAGGQLTYEPTDDGVAFQYKGRDKKTTVLWSQLEAQPEPADAA